MNYIKSDKNPGDGKLTIKHDGLVIGTFKANQDSDEEIILPLVNGTSGTNGTSGINGTSGSSGSSGVNGTSGTSGSSGSSGSSGVDGAGGTSGTSGVNGTNGSSGTSGSSGINGTSGVNGTSGSSGKNGTNGTSGVNGTPGSSGSSGTSGASGANGTSGSSGNDGNDGSNSGRWYYSGYTTTPGSGRFAIDNDFGNSTEVYIARESLGGIDYYGWLLTAQTLIDNGNIGYLQITEVGNNSIIAIYEIYGNGSITFSGGVWTFDRFNILVANGSINKTDYTISWVFNGLDGTSGSSGTSGKNGTSGISGTSGTNGTSGVSVGPPTYVPSNSIQWDSPKYFGNNTSPRTGALTNNTSSAKVGMIQKIYHNDSSISLPASWVKLGAGVYIPSILNIIYVEYMSATRQEYWITQ